MAETLSFNKLGLSIKKKELTPINLDELSKFKVVPGHIFLNMKNSRPILLLKAGDPVMQEFVSKYSAKQGLNFSMLAVVNLKEINQIIVQFDGLKSDDPAELLKTRDILLEWFYLNYWSDSKECSLLDIIYCCSKVFLRIEDSVLKKIQNVSMMFYTRSLRLASFSVFVALSLGYLDFSLLSDLFHVSMLLDFGLVGGELDYFITQACEKERVNPGDGLNYLDDLDFNGKNVDIDFFYSHPLKGKELVQENYGDVFFDKKITSVISRHHEYGEKNGFPLKLKLNEISDFEKIPLFLDGATPFKEIVFKKDDGRGYLKKILVKTMKENIKFRDLCRDVYTKVSTSLSTTKGKRKM